MGPFTQIVLTKEQRNKLKENLKPTTLYRLVQRVNTILLASEELNNKEISIKVNLSVVAISHWMTRYAKKGIEGINDLPCSGKPLKIN